MSDYSRRDTETSAHDEGSRPSLRRELFGLAGIDPLSGRIVELPTRYRQVGISANGSLDSTEVQIIRFKCGCAPIGPHPDGGLCGLCPPENGLTCARCFTHCGCCGIGLCNEHQNRFHIENVGLAVFCPRCHGEAARSRRVRRVVKAIVRLFVQADGDA